MVNHEPGRLAQAPGTGLGALAGQDEQRRAPGGLHHLALGAATTAQLLGGPG